jgi:hypothetical protein
MGVTIDGYAIEGGFDDDGPATSFGIAQSLGQVTSSVRSPATFEHLGELVEVVADLGFDEVRLTIEWARIEPRPTVRDEDALCVYERAIDAARRRGLSVVVVLCDVAWPSWVGQEPWLSSWAPERFAAYAGFVARRLGDRVRAYVTLRAPNVAARDGWILARRPPFRRNAHLDAASALDGMLLAHQLAADELDAKAPTAARALLFGSSADYGDEGAFRDLVVRGLDASARAARARSWASRLEERGVATTAGRTRNRAVVDLDAMRSTERWTGTPTSEWWLEGDDLALLAAAVDHAEGAVTTVELGAGPGGWGAQLPAAAATFRPDSGVPAVHLRGALGSTGPLSEPRGLLTVDQHGGAWQLRTPSRRIADGLALLLA